MRAVISILAASMLAVTLGCGREAPPVPEPPSPPVPVGPGEKAPATAPAQATPAQPAPSEPAKVPEKVATAGDEKKLRRVKALVSGKVQGVGFRAFTSRRATALGLTGTVRNLKDGRVEAVIEGTATQVDELIKAIRTGPAGARVDAVELEEQAHRGEFSTFSVVR